MYKTLFLSFLLPLSVLYFSVFFQNISAQTPPPVEPGVSQTLAKWRAANYSDVRYKLNITLEKGAPLMKGDIEIRVKLTDEGAKNDLILDWRTTQFANDKDKPFANVVAVNEMTGAQAARLHRRESGETALFIKSSLLQSEDFSRSALIASEPLALQSNEHLIIPKKFLKTGENTIKINFASPIKTSGAAVTRYVDKEDGAEYIYSLFVPSDASTAFPVFDQPDLKARFTIDIKAPKFWEVVTNAPKWTSNSQPPNYKEDWEKGFLLWQFEETKPISTYVFAFAAGQFQTYVSVDTIGKNKLPSTIYVRQSQSEKMNDHLVDVMELNENAVKYLEDWFDYKFPFPKYDLVLIPEFPFGGMEHAGSTFLREDRVIFPTEPTKNDYITRANVIFHEAAHQWFGDTVTMKWFDDLWLKEGFAEFMAYKTMEKVLPEYNAWKIFYERNKQAAYLTDVTRGTTPIYQEIPNLSSAKSAYGNIVYRKAPSFLRQAEFYLGEKEFQTAVRAFLKKHEFANAEWADLVSEFQNVGWLKDELGYRNSNEKDKSKYEEASKNTIAIWAKKWVTKRGLPIVRVGENGRTPGISIWEKDSFDTNEPRFDFDLWTLNFNVLFNYKNGKTVVKRQFLDFEGEEVEFADLEIKEKPVFVFPNYQDYGYGIFLLDEKSRAYVLENIQTEKDDFLRTMMWGSLWDSLRFYELAPEDYVKLVIKNINVETDESTIRTLLGRVSTAMNYYIKSSGGAQSEPSAVADGLTRKPENSQIISNAAKTKLKISATADDSDLQMQIEKLLINKIKTAQTVGQKITYFRALQSVGAGEQTKQLFKDLLNNKSRLKDVELKTKDKFDLVTRLIILGDKDALSILANLEKTETGDAAKRYAYAAKAGIATKENKLKYWQDFTGNKEISESYIESAFTVFNTPRHAELTLPYLEKALAELPNLKRNRKIFFVNGWLASFIGGQKSEQALNIVNKFLTDNPNLDKDLRNKILENADNLERAVKIRAKYGK